MRAGFVGRMGPTSARGNLRKWGAAVAAARNGERNAIICCLGDSTTAGAGGAQINGGMDGGRAVAYPKVLASYLNTNVHRAYASSYNGTQGRSSTSYPLYNPEAVFDTAADWTGNGNTFGSFLLQGNVNNSRFKWTPDFEVDTFEVYGVDISNAGNVNVYFNGSGTAAYTYNSNSGTPALTKRTFTVALGTNTIELAKTDQTLFYISQIVAYNSAEKSILVFNGGSPSFTAQNIATETNPYSSLNALRALRPDLTIINVGLNDFLSPPAEATWKGYVQSMINAAKASGDAVLSFPNSRGSGNEPTFRQWMQDLAAANNIMYLDVAADCLGTVAQANANGDMSGDSLHPNGQGYFKIGNDYYGPNISRGLLL